MTPEKIAVLVITGVIAVLLSMTLMESSDGVVPRAQVRSVADDEPEPIPSIDDLMAGQGKTVLRPIRPSPEPAPRPEPAHGRYRIRRGDTLEKIALAHLGRRSAFKRILELNPGLDPRALKEGDEIVMPAANGGGRPDGAGHDEGARADARTTPPPSRPKTHTVRSGESLALIAKRLYGKESEWKRILDANRDQIRSPEKIREGMVLKLP